MTNEREQRAIADYLDRETAQIDAFIAKNEELIALLTERRAAIVSRRVAQGLNPDAPMAETVVDGLGLVPAHWKVERFARVAKIRGGLLDPLRLEVRELGTNSSQSHPVGQWRAP